jgi:sugar lactone lactonase YvrE
MTRRPLLAALALLAAWAPPAAAAPDCTPGRTAARTVLSGQGVLESAIVDARGRLFYTDTSADALMRLDRPGAAPRQVAGGIDSGGGLAWMPDGHTLLVGRGDGAVPGLLGAISPAAGLLAVDVDTGRVRTYATGLTMANGVARAADGTVYASTDVGTSIDRVAPGGRVVQRNWATVLSGNGLAIDPTGRWLYVNQTFVPAAIQRVDLRDPSRVQTWVRGAPEDTAAGLDGLAIDRRGRLYAAANGGGQVWRVGTDRRVCVLARGLLLPSATAVGRSRHGFSQGHVYVVTFSGVVAEITLG